MDKNIPGNAWRKRGMAWRGVNARDPLLQRNER